MALSDAQHEYFYVRMTRIENEMTRELQAMRKCHDVIERVQRYVMLAIELDMLRKIRRDLSGLRG